MQYLQSNIQSLLMRSLSNETHLPSGVNEWQHPSGIPFPMPPVFFLPLPDEEQETSYLALSVSIFSVSSAIMVSLYHMRAQKSNIRLKNPQKKVLEEIVKWSEFVV